MSLYVLEGLRPWVIQRVSAVYIVMFILYATFCFFTADTVTDKTLAYESWKGWLYNPFNTSVSGIFVIALLFHAWIGMRDVVLDYVHNIMLRIFILGTLVGILIGSGLWVFRILLLSVAG
jgi:succinate dehydrogenase / fumarate reductase membrane anchor subunit